MKWTRYLLPGALVAITARFLATPTWPTVAALALVLTARGVARVFGARIRGLGVAVAELQQRTHDLGDIRDRVRALLNRPGSPR